MMQLDDMLADTLSFISLHFKCTHDIDMHGATNPEFSVGFSQGRLREK